MRTGTAAMSNPGRYLLVLLSFAGLGGPAVVPADEAQEWGLEAARLRQYDQAIARWRVLAERGDAEAQYRLGAMFQNGRGVPQDHARSSN